MKNFHYVSFGLGTLIACAISTLAYAQQPSYSNPSSYSSSPAHTADDQTVRIGIINTKKCLDESKLGKLEQVNFERKQNKVKLELQDKNQELIEIDSKLRDDDYMDSISEETAKELRRKKISIRDKGMELQNRRMQELQEEHVSIIQKLTEVIGKASAQVAQDPNGQPLDIILTDEACTFYSPRLDVTARIVAKMDAIFDAEKSR